MLSLWHQQQRDARSTLAIDYKTNLAYIKDNTVIQLSSLDSQQSLLYYIGLYDAAASDEASFLQELAAGAGNT